MRELPHAIGVWWPTQNSYGGGRKPRVDEIFLISCKQKTEPWRGMNMRTGSKAKEEISGVVAKIQAWVLAFVCAVIGGLGVFVATVWLLLQDGPQVGSHLQ